MAVKRPTPDQQGVSRRDFLKFTGALAGALIAPRVISAEAKSATTYKDFFANMNKQAEAVGGIWAFPEASTLPRPGNAPFLPATQDEVISHAKDVEAKTGNVGIGWGQAVFPRVIVLPSDHTKDHVKDTYGAIKDFGTKRNWGDITAWQGAWVYPMMMMGGIEDIKNNKQVQVMSNGKMVDIDPVRLDNDAISMSVVDRGNPKMAVYMVPQNGEVHARLPQDTTESAVTMAFAPNKHHIDTKAKASGDDIPAIIVRGVATAPVTISYSRPIDDNGNYETLVTQTRLEPLTGNVTVDMDFPAGDYIGDYSPFISITMPVVATTPQGETEVMFVPGSDVKPGNIKYADKHRVTVKMLKAGQSL